MNHRNDKPPATPPIDIPTGSGSRASGIPSRAVSPPAPNGWRPGNFPTTKPWEPTLGLSAPLSWVAESPPLEANASPTARRRMWENIWGGIAHFCATERRMRTTDEHPCAEYSHLATEALRCRQHLAAQLSSGAARAPDQQWTVTAGGLFLPSHVPFAARPPDVAKFAQILTEETIQIYRLLGPNVRRDSPSAQSAATRTAVTAPYAAIVPAALVRTWTCAASLQAAPLSAKELQELAAGAALVRDSPETTAFLARFWWERRAQCPSYPSPLGNLFAPAAHTGESILGSDGYIYADSFKINLSHVPIRASMTRTETASHVYLTNDA
jgi:hypothetical protein